MTTTATNGRIQRKTLASEIDRLDSILDGLADNLNEAVADAVRESTAAAVKLAVQETLKAVLTTPEFVEQLRGAIGIQTNSAPALPTTASNESPIRSMFHRVRDRVGRARDWLQSKWQACWQWMRERVSRCLPAAIIVMSALLSGVLSYFGGPVLAAILGAISGAALAAAGLVLVPLYLLSRQAKQFERDIAEMADPNGQASPST